MGPAVRERGGGKPVFERFTERARRVIILAREEAGRFRHDFVGTEHILLGLIRDGEGIATAVLQRLGLRLETVKAEVERALAGFPKTLTFGEVPFTPQAKRVLELSIEEARQLGHNYIGTEHLLLGLMKEGQSIAAKILESLGARLDEVRQETLALLGDQYYPRPKKRSQYSIVSTSLAPSCARIPSWVTSSCGSVIAGRATASSCPSSFTRKSSS